MMTNLSYVKSQYGNETDGSTDCMANNNDNDDIDDDNDNDNDGDAVDT